MVRIIAGYRRKASAQATTMYAVTGMSALSSDVRSMVSALEMGA